MQSKNLVFSHALEFITLFFDFRVAIGQTAFSADYVLSWVPSAWIEEVGEVMRYEVQTALRFAAEPH